MTVYDRRLALRAASFAWIAVLVTVVIVVATDEGGPWPGRIGMASAIAPVAGMLGTLGAVRLAEARGELRALGALGVARARVVLGAVLGGCVIGLAGPILGVLGVADLAPLFPRPAGARVWVPHGGGLCEFTLGLCVDAHGVLSLATGPHAAPVAMPAAAGQVALLALAAIAIAGPVWIAVPVASARRRAVVGGFALVVTIASFQAVAAHRAPAVVLMVAPVVLIVDAMVGRGRLRIRA